MKTIKFILGCVALFGLLSCEDLLDPKVDSRYGDEYALNHPKYSEGILMNAYLSIATQMDSYNENFLDAATDNAATTAFGSTMYSLGAGGITATSNPVANWGTAYTAISHINMFMENCLDTSQVIFSISDSVLDAKARQRLTGEAYFLRAYWGSELLKVYGGLSENGVALGYPIITSVLTEEQRDSALALGRDTYEDCVLQIFKDCDSAIAFLPILYLGSDVELGSQHTGRASGQAAYVLKSRVAINAASPAFQESSASNIAKWERAAVISQEAIDEGMLSYRALSYIDVTTPSLKSTPTDFVWRKYYNNNSIEKRNLPPSFLGSGNTNPSQNLVNAFPADNGYPITHSLALYDAQNPYSNRDPRLKNTVIYNGEQVELDGRKLEVATSITELITNFDTISVSDDGNGNLSYVIETNVDTIIRQGYDSPGYDYRCTRTGYYLRKWVSDKKEMLKLREVKTAEHAKPILRSAEVYHNLAEASFEATLDPSALVPGCSKSSISILKEIRKENMGIDSDPYLTEASNDETLYRALVHNERRLEFAFENHRYFDLRRWKEVLTTPVYGMTVTQLNDGTYVYTGTDPNEPQITVEERLFSNDSYYYSPLPYSEMAKSQGALLNNKGW